MVLEDSRIMLKSLWDPTIISCVAYPKEENSRTEDSEATVIVKLPSFAVITPLRVPFSMTATPARGPESSLTVPDTLICACGETAPEGDSRIAGSARSGNNDDDNTMAAVIIR